jgi:hypothetical protein
MRHIRAAGQHSDARHRAVEGFHALGLSYPPTDWGQAWIHVATAACGAFSTLREEIHAASLPDDPV